MYVTVFRKTVWKMSQYHQYNNTFVPSIVLNEKLGDFPFTSCCTHRCEFGSVSLLPGLQFHHLLNKEFVLETSDWEVPAPNFCNLVRTRESCDIPIVFIQIIPLFRKDFHRTKIYLNTKVPLKNLLLFKAPLIPWNLVSWMHNNRIQRWWYHWVCTQRAGPGTLLQYPLAGWPYWVSVSSSTKWQ